VCGVICDIAQTKVPKSDSLEIVAFYNALESQNLPEDHEYHSMNQQDQKIPEHDSEYYSEDHALHM
jgi:hypothetical protein